MSRTVLAVHVISKFVAGRKFQIWGI